MVEMVCAAPAFVKVGSIFILILVINRFGIPLGISIIINAVILSLWTGSGLYGLVKTAHKLAEPDSYLLFVVIILLLFLAEALDKSGRMQKTIAALKDSVKNNRLLYAGFPALVGLLPMPGGAVFSAPMVASVDTGNNLSNSHKVAINYWFRHIWEYWWPLYPGVVLAIQISHLPLALFYLIQMPLTIISALAGYFFILRKIPVSSQGQNPTVGTMHVKDVLLTIGPIIILVVISLAGSFALPHYHVSATNANLIAMLVGLTCALGLIFTQQKGSLTASLKTFVKPSTWFLLMVFVGVQIFAGVLQTPQDGTITTLVTLMRDEFVHMGIPLLLVMALVPFISGAVTGVAVGFVGSSFPLVFALLGPDPALGKLVATTTFAYAFGYMGMMLSPLHVCFVVTNEFFKSRLIYAYRYMIGPVISVIVLSLCLAGLYLMVF